MDFETFDRLYKSNPVVFTLAMEIFLDKGRPCWRAAMMN